MDSPTFALHALSEPESLRAVYLRRLARLQRLRREHEGDLNKLGIRLLDRSLFAAFCACREVGAEDEARRILRGDPTYDRPAA